MGHASNGYFAFSKAEEFLSCFDDFVRNFDKYLQTVCSKIDWNSIDTKEMMKFFHSITNFYDYFNSAPRERIKTLVTPPAKKSTRTSFLQFNYTNVLDELLARRSMFGFDGLDENLHVHGQMGDGNPTIGVNHEAQIENEDIRKDPIVQNVFIKPNYLDFIQNRYQSQDIPRNKAVDVIKQSSVICAFGTSIGETDIYWWNIIGEWLKSTEGTLIIFDVRDIENDRVSPLAVHKNWTYLQREQQVILDRFAELSNLGKGWVVANPDKIFVELNSDLFNFKLPLKAEDKAKTPSSVT
jgi:hypothetical protein